jgi:hypothetical protein
MSEAKFTQGPWQVIDDEHDNGVWSVKQYAPQGISMWIAEVVDTYDGTTEPNARLIAAAPLLYEACKAVLAEHGECWCDVWHRENQQPCSYCLCLAAMAAADGDHP